MKSSRRGIGLLAGALIAAAIVITLTHGGGGVPAPPAPGVAAETGPGGLFGYRRARASALTARATAGNAHVLFFKSPGGAVATAARVAAYRPLIDRAVAGTGIDPALLEGLVFVESAGLPDAIAGTSVADAAGLTQILPSTGTSLLGMHIDLSASRRLTAEIDAGGSVARLRALEARRAAIDQRFDPARALAATVRYLEYAESQFGGRQDLAFVSYHMGVGNLHDVLSDYDGGEPVPYVQLYFDSAPDHNADAYRLLSGLGDDSSLYWWRILGAERVMRLYRTDRAALTRLASLQTADEAGGSVLHPPGHPPRYTDPSALAAAYQHRALVPLPRNHAALGLVYDNSIGSGAGAVHAPRSLYRGLTPTALKLLIRLAAAVRALSGGVAPLHVASAVADAGYLSARGVYDPMAQTGYSFTIARRYRSGAQAGAFQAVLDRLQSLNLIAWAAEGSVIHVTVAPGAGADGARPGRGGE